MPSLLSVVSQLQVCLPCAKVETLELVELNHVLPFKSWAVND